MGDSRLSKLIRSSKGFAVLFFLFGVWSLEFRRRCLRAVAAAGVLSSLEIRNWVYVNDVSPTPSSLSEYCFTSFSFHAPLFASLPPPL
jgi:hypothetical protein